MKKQKKNKPARSKGTITDTPKPPQRQLPLDNPYEADLNHRLDAHVKKKKS